MKTTIAMTSNYVRSDGDPDPYLGRIAEAGFTHVLWAHHAWSDYVYVEPEIDHIARCLRKHGLKLNDLHCPTGKDQAWGSPVEFVRRAGIEVVKNRIAMAAALACDVVVMHIPMEPPDPAARRAYWRRQRRTMDALAPWAKKHKVRMALENTLPGNFDTLEKFFALRGPDVMGLCYDAGHGNAKIDWPGNGLERLERVKDRVIDLHLHDNDCTDDLHWLPFTGTVDWERLAEIIPTTSYKKNVIPIEAGIKEKDTTPAQERRFLRRCAAAARRFGALLDAAAASAPKCGPKVAGGAASTPAEASWRRRVFEQAPGERPFRRTASGPSCTRRR